MFVNKMSQMMVRESSDSQYTSEDAELSDQVHDEINQLNKMMHSASHVDKRFIQLFKVRRADQQVQSHEKHQRKKSETSVKPEAK